MRLFVLMLAACGSTQPPLSPQDTAPDSAPADSPSEVALCCGEDINAPPTPQSATLTYTWTAWEYVPSCPVAATSVEVLSNGPDIAVLADLGGNPGPVLVPPTAPTPIGGGREVITFGALPLAAGQRIWIALKNAMPGSFDMGSSAPFALMGKAVRITWANGLSGPWDKGNTMDRPIFSVRGCR